MQSLIFLCILTLYKQRTQKRTVNKTEDSMEPGSIEDFITSPEPKNTRKINDRRKKNVPVENERRKNKERRNHWTMDEKSGRSSFTG